VSGIDRRSLVSGIITGLFFTLPTAVVQRIVGTDSVVAQVMLVVILFSGALAGFAAARMQPPAPLQHGAIAGAITLLGAQLVFSVWSRSFPSPVALVFWLLAFACLGTIGAWLALWSAQQQSRTGGNP
jgi:putative membrane protein (TIGR04086 family)